jgi:hypothetical protein
MPKGIVIIHPSIHPSVASKGPSHETITGLQLRRRNLDRWIQIKNLKFVTFPLTSCISFLSS